MAKKKIARLCSRPEDYQQLGLKKEIQPWEDGLRTSGKFGEYEWWYSDLKLEDGSSLVIVFYTGPMTAMVKGFRPNVSFNLTRPDGTRLEDNVEATLEDCVFEKDRCYVKVGPCYITGDLHQYTIHYESPKAQAHIHLAGKTAPWRPETGHIRFGETKYFAWIPSIPEGEINGTLTLAGKTESLRGSGYHDHNWGNTGMFFLMHHWYWGRARIGPYQVISSYITARKEYGHEHFMVFMLAKDGVLLGDKGDCVSYSQTGPVLDEVTGKHYHKQLAYDYNDGTQHYRISYHQQEVIEQFSLEHSKTMAAAKTNGPMRVLMRLIGLEPAYVRMTGTAVIEKLEGDTVVERHEAPALWELMYFGQDEDV